LLFENVEKVTRIRSEERPELWPDKWILTIKIPLSMMRQEFTSSWLRNPLQKLDHPPYSSDLDPCYFWLFPKLKKNALKVRRFADILDIQFNVTKLLRGIPE
jgi:hypothetical protein